MPSQIKSLNGDGTKNPNLFRASNPKNANTTTKTSSGMVGGGGSGIRKNPTTMNKRSVSTGTPKFQMGTTHHAAGTVPEYLKGKK